MAERWFRFYEEALNDPKVQLLDPFLFKSWVNLLCLSSKNGGKFSSPDAVSFALRVSVHKAAEIVTMLCNKSLLDRNDDGSFSPHNWKQRQFHSDVTDPTAAERMRNYRNRRRNEESNETASVTVPRVRDTDTERKKDKSTADAVPSKYAFENGVIRLTQKDLDKWTKAFSHLDLQAELIGLTSWANEQPPEKWFFAVSGALTKKNREAKARVEQSKNGPEFKWRSGIEGVV